MLDVNMERCVMSVKNAVERPFVHMERFVLPVKNVEIYAVHMAKGNMIVWNVMEDQYVATNDSGTDVHCAILSINPFNVRFTKEF